MRWFLIRKINVLLNTDRFTVVLSPPHSNIKIKVGTRLGRLEHYGKLHALCDTVNGMLCTVLVTMYGTLYRL